MGKQLTPSQKLEVDGAKAAGDLEEMARLEVAYRLRPAPTLPANRPAARPTLEALEIGGDYLFDVFCRCGVVYRIDQGEMWDRMDEAGVNREDAVLGRDDLRDTPRL